MSRRFHTELMPHDCNGLLLQPMDLVSIGAIPSHYWSDPEFNSLQNFSGGYGLITYYPGSEIEFDPYFQGDKDHPGWVSREAKLVYVLSRRIENAHVATCDFWLPPQSLKKLPFNSIIMNIFAQYPWQMREADGPGSELFVSEGMKQFDYLRAIIQTPYSELVKAHEAAMAVLKFSQQTT